MTTQGTPYYISAATLLNRPCIHYSIATKSDLRQAVVTGGMHLSNDQLVEPPPVPGQEGAEVLRSSTETTAGSRRHDHPLVPTAVDVMAGTSVWLETHLPNCSSGHLVCGPRYTAHIETVSFGRRPWILASPHNRTNSCPATRVQLPTFPGSG